MATKPTNTIVHVAEDDVNLPNTGQPNKTIPSALLLTTGYDKNETVFAEHLNYVFDNFAEWLKYLEIFTDEINTDFQQQIDDINQELDDTAFVNGDGTTASGDIGGNVSFAVDGTVVRTSGAQSIADQKTFTTPPIVPTTTPSNNQAPSWQEVKRLTTWNRLGTPLVIYNSTGVAGLTDIAVGGGIPDGSELKINFQCYFDGAPASIDSISKYLLVDGGSSDTASDTNANMIVKYNDTASRTYASAGQISVIKESGRVRLSGFQNRTDISIILTVSHYREQS